MHPLIMKHTAIPLLAVSTALVCLIRNLQRIRQVSRWPMLPPEHPVGPLVRSCPVMVGTMLAHGRQSTDRRTDHSTVVDAAAVRP